MEKKFLHFKSKLELPIKIKLISPNHVWKHLEFSGVSASKIHNKYTKHCSVPCIFDTNIPNKEVNVFLEIFRAFPHSIEKSIIQKNQRLAGI